MDNDFKPKSGTIPRNKTLSRVSDAVEEECKEE